MKTVPLYPYLQNIVKESHRRGCPPGTEEYVDFLRSQGMIVPIDNVVLEFPDSFSEQDLLLFKLRWA